MTNTVVFEQQLANMLLRVTEGEGVRTLWINDTPQSQMSLDHPTQLITAYEQVMASWALFLPTANDLEQALVLGLGGGSAIRHLSHYYPDCQITAVEYSDHLAKVAYEYFALPNSNKLTVMIEDAFSLVKNPHTLDAPAYDLLLVDLFDVAQASTYHFSRDFWAHCLDLMNPESVLVINLWAKNQADFTAVLQQIGEVFQWRMLLVPVAESSNVVVFIFHPDGEHYRLAALEAQALALSAAMQLQFEEYLRQIVAQNTPQLERCITV